MKGPPSEDNHEWKSIRSELCGMLEEQLDDDVRSTPRDGTQRGHGYVRLRIGAADRVLPGGLLRLKHRERARRARLGPFDHGLPGDRTVRSRPIADPHRAPSPRLDNGGTSGGNGANGGGTPLDGGDRGRMELARLLLRPIGH